MLEEEEAVTYLRGISTKDAIEVGKEPFKGGRNIPRWQNHRGCPLYVGFTPSDCNFQCSCGCGKIPDGHLRVFTKPYLSSRSWRISCALHRYRKHEDIVSSIESAIVSIRPLRP